MSRTVSSDWKTQRSENQTLSTAAPASLPLWGSGAWDSFLRPRTGEAETCHGVIQTCVPLTPLQTPEVLSADFGSALGQWLTVPCSKGRAAKIQQDQTILCYRYLLPEGISCTKLWRCSTMARFSHGSTSYSPTHPFLLLGLAAPCPAACSCHWASASYPTLGDAAMEPF